MIPTVKKDLRVVKTLEAIRKSFEELLCEKDFLEITVTFGRL